MTAYDELAQRYIDTWNRPIRLPAVDQLYAEDARYVDPLGVADGREAIASMIGAVQQLVPRLQLPVGRAGRRAPQPGPVRLGAGAGRVTGTDRGFDVAVCDDSSRI